MGKKYNDFDNGMYDQSRNNQIADHLESYIYAIQNLLILEGKRKEDIKKSVKVIQKCIKNLRKGKPEKVFDKHRYEEMYEDDY